MKRIIVDYKKLTSEILNLLVEKFPDGYGIKDVIRFTNHKGQYVEAVEVATEDTVYLVKISDELVDSMENFYEEEEDNIERDLEIDLDLTLKVPIDEDDELDSDEIEDENGDDYGEDENGDDYNEDENGDNDYDDEEDDEDK